MKEESEKVGLKFNIQKTKIMASGPTTSWQIDGETVETVTDFTFSGSKITADGGCSHEIKTFTPWKKSYDHARTWCSGKTWRERVEREVGGGIGMGKTCKPKAVSFQCMTKFTTKKKSKKKKKSGLVLWKKQTKKKKKQKKKKK